MISPARLYYHLAAHGPTHMLLRLAAGTLRRLGYLRDPLLPIDALSLKTPALRAASHLWRRIHWSSGDGMMPPHQLLAIYRLAAELTGPGDVVELGSWTGLTTCYLGTACRLRGSGRTWGVDTFEGTKEGDGPYASIAKFEDSSTLTAFRTRVEKAGLTDVIEPLVGYTNEVASRYPGGPIRMLFIDADHSYEGVRSDFELWAPYVVPDGLIVFHDYSLPAFGVSRFVDNEVVTLPWIDASPGLVTENVFAVRKRASGPVVAPPTRQPSVPVSSPVEKLPPVADRVAAEALSSSGDPR
jgi:predicted O-methyltransferase YrrM